MRNKIKPPPSQLQKIEFLEARIETLNHEIEVSHNTIAEQKDILHRQNDSFRKSSIDLEKEKEKNRSLNRLKAILTLLEIE